MTPEQSLVYLDPTDEAGRRVFAAGDTGPLVMLNLLRFRAVADYAATPGLAPVAPITGAEAYARYLAHTQPLLEAAGGKMLFLGDGGPWFVGPPAERWDLMLLLRHASRATLLAFATHEGYLAGPGHRLAALEDARMLPLTRGSGEGASGGRQPSRPAQFPS
jgi:uncharacterized protein (DUF1330 family)